MVVARAFVDDLERNYPRGRGSHMSIHVVLPCSMRFRDDSMSGNSKYIHTSNRCARVNPYANDYHSLVATERIVFVLFLWLSMSNSFLVILTNNICLSRCGFYTLTFLISR